MSPTASGLERSEITVYLRGAVAVPPRLSAAELIEVQAEETVATDGFEVDELVVRVPR